MSTTKIKRTKPDRLNSIDRIDSLNLLIDHGIDIQSRMLTLTGAVNQSMYEATVSGLSILNQTKPKEIMIRLNTYGGDVYTALGIFDLIKMNKAPVDILSIGQCMSAGTLIIQAARKRLSTPLTKFMVHAGSDAISGTYQDVQRYVRHAKDLETEIKEIFCERCEWPSERYQHYHEHDTYLTAQEAQNIKLIDEVIK